MNINDAIKMLRDAKKEGVKSIVFAYWTADMFDREDDEAWEASASAADDIDWSMTHDLLCEAIEQDDAYNDEEDDEE